MTQPSRYDVFGNLINLKAHRIIDLMYNNHIITATMRFLMVVDNSIIGNGNYQISKTKIALTNLASSQQRISQYLSTQKSIDNLHLRSWGILPIPGIVMYFITNAQAVKYLPQHPEFKKLKITGNKEITWL